jgi:hypothetical protein
MRQLTEPNTGSATLDDWQRFILRTTVQGGGFMLVEIDGMDSAAAPSVKRGSRLEINGAFYTADADEAVSGSVSAGYNWVYAVPDAGGVTFRYSATKPAWSAVKGGWYDGNNRAVLEFTYAGGGYIGKLVMDIYNYKSRFEVNTAIPIPDTGGALVINAAKVNEPEMVWLDPGAYRIEMKAGTGGTGGTGGNGGTGGYNGGNETRGAAGGGGATGEQKIYKVYITEQKLITVLVGGNGAAGGAGGTGGNGGNTGGGGGGGTGGGSNSIRHSGGGGGGSPQNWARGGHGGVGGRGYGVASNGSAASDKYSGGGGTGGGAGGTAGSFWENGGSFGENNNGGIGGYAPLSTTHGYVRIYRTQ